MAIFKLSKEGYFLNHRGQVEKIKYKDYLYEFGSDETTTPRGVAPRLYVDGKKIMTWGVRGNNHALYANYETKKEAKKALYDVWEQNVDQDWNASRFYETKKEMFEDLAETHETSPDVIKRYFRLQKFQIQKAIQSKVKHDNRPSFTKEMMIDYINKNKEMVLFSLKELDELKKDENKEIWQAKANALIQKVSNNDFRVLKWKDIYNLIRENA